MTVIVKFNNKTLIPASDASSYFPLHAIYDTVLKWNTVKEFKDAIENISDESFNEFIHNTSIEEIKNEIIKYWLYHEHSEYETLEEAVKSLPEDTMVDIYEYDFDFH